MFLNVIYVNAKRGIDQAPGHTPTLAYPGLHLDKYIYGLHRGVTKASNKYVIMVVVDRLSKYAYFYELSH